MRRTPIMRRYEHALALVNDQLCFSAMASYELSKTIVSLSTSKGETFTTEAFPDNPNTERLFRKVKDLSAFASKADDTTYRMGVVLGYEHLVAYLKDVLNFRKALQPSPQDQLKNEALEETVAQRLEGWSPGAAKLGYFRTIGYLRHLRNSFAHAHVGPSNELASYAAAHAYALGRFWDNGRTDIGKIDFRALPNSDLTPEAAFALMNLTRICLREIDRLIAETLSKDAVLKIALEDVWKHHAHIRTVAPRLAAKARGLIEAEFGERLPKELVIAKAEKFVKDCDVARRTSMGEKDV